MDEKTIKKALRHFEKQDPRLSSVAKSIGLLVYPLRKDPFTKLSRSIVAQQLSTKAAATIYGRFVDLFPGEKKIKPEFVLKTPDAKLRSAGMSWAKAASLKDLAEKCTGGTITTRKLSKLDNERVIDLLTSVRGIGVWTAEMYLIFGLGRPDVFPYDDIGIQRGIQQIYKLRKRPDRNRMEKFARVWSPYASVGSLYTWRYIDGDPDIVSS